MELDYFIGASCFPSFCLEVQQAASFNHPTESNVVYYQHNRGRIYLYVQV
jgi:hypothetical protein